MGAAKNAWTNNLINYGGKRNCKCPNCNKLYEYDTIEQTPGCRDKEELYCPWCYYTIETSMTYDYIGIRRVENEKNT